MGFLGRGIEDMDKLLRAFGSEGVKGISLCQVEGGKKAQFSKVTSAEESENYF